MSERWDATTRTGPVDWSNADDLTLAQQSRTDRASGQGQLSQRLSEYDVGDVFISLTYITEPLTQNEIAYEWDPYVYIRRPVDYQQWSESGQGGFVPWLIIPRG